jgi:hypothetical protein
VVSTISWPASVIPDGTSEEVITPEGIQSSPNNVSIQTNGSSVHKFRITYSFKPLDKSQRLAVKPVLAQLGRKDLIMPIYQTGLDTTSAGSVVLDSGSSGFSLKVKSVNSAYTFKAGQMISVVTSGNHYVYMIASDSAAGTTTRTLTLTSEIRSPDHAVNDVVHISPAYIQGYVSGDYRKFDMDVAFFTSISLSITERY